MMQTVISVFENRRAAQGALDRLLSTGFRREDVHLEEGAALANTALAANPRASDRYQTGPERGVLSSIGRFFASLFGQDPPAGYVDRYSEAIWHGHPVIVVDAKDADEANRATGIMHEFGALDIDERGAHWRAATAAPDSASDSVIGQGRQLQQPRHIFPGSVRAVERERAMAAAERAREARELGSDSN